MNQFVQRLANYVANELFIKGLANSRTFQKFAVRTEQTLQDFHKTGTETITKTFEETLAKQQSRANSTSAAASGGMSRGPPQPPLQGFPGFVAAFFKELRNDLGMGGGKQQR